MGVKRAVMHAVTRLLPARYKRFIHQAELKKTAHLEFVNLSFSQEGEDLVLQRLMEEKSSGFYVDVGAHHPFRFSNTYKFYLMGWRGINIDPLPGSMDLFKKYRSRDINLEIPILDNDALEMVYYMFNDPALNSFDGKAALELEKKTAYKIIHTIKLTPSRLDKVLSTHLPVDTVIDFLSVDVEGMDLDVLRSNDWTKFRPTYIIAESISTRLVNDLDSPLTRFLAGNGYVLTAKTVNSLFFYNKQV